ncbi:hypothetical protein [Methylocystis heyeri]|uniref:Uncharacterized protein n=1 Tax=Methylocystis heyeri TaxID=391905 RepID=A0A6B8KGJ7_9HYPH|nr:hypothetical protein [Methylocystis heyeri]QGM45678.1 hypothetical protein H2LOC_008175 [Methylocystis heyeri]
MFRKVAGQGLLALILPEASRMRRLLVFVVFSVAQHWFARIWITIV